MCFNELERTGVPKFISPFQFELADNMFDISINRCLNPFPSQSQKEEHANQSNTDDKQEKHETMCPPKPQNLTIETEYRSFCLIKPIRFHNMELGSIQFSQRLKKQTKTPKFILKSFPRNYGGLTIVAL
jgi:hypothetical protein